MVFGKIYTYPGNPRVFKAQIAAKYNGLDLDLSTVEMGKTNKTADYLSKFPTGKVPAFESSNGETLFESGAIAYFVAGSKKETQLLGRNLYELSQIHQWTAFADTQIYPTQSAWLYPILGYSEFHHPTTEKAKEDAKKFMASLDLHLLKKTFLVGETVTLADIIVVCALYPLYKMVFDPTFRSEFVNVNRWFVTCINQPQFKSVIGEFTLCEAMAVYKKPEKKKEPKAEKPKEVAKKEEEEPTEEKPKAKNPLDSLPPSKLVLDEWKRVYSNNDTRPTAVDWFWNNYDAEGYSLWKVDYKYNEELTLTFMSSNLIGGFFQRLERARKYAFGSMVVLGQDNKNEITGFFVVRGQEIPPEIYEAADYESYNFVKANTNEASVREAFNAVIAWDATIQGKPFSDGKVFK